MNYLDSNFDQFLRRPLLGLERTGLADSSLGAQRALSQGEFDDLVPGGALSMEKILAGIIIANRGTIGGWNIGDDALTSANITIDSVNKRILISDGTNNRVLMGFQQDGF